MKQTVNAAFQGGGVIGIAHIGAVAELEKAGYVFKRVAGTSAGAIIACMLAAQFSYGEIENEIMNLDFKQFVKKSGFVNFPLIGDLIALSKTFGIYSTKNFETWLNSLLKQKNVNTFKDLKLPDGSYRIRIIASDLTNQKMIILPDDLANYGIDADSFNVAKAVAMSISIPLLFKPCVLKDAAGKENLIADGGLFCNYPNHAFDDDLQTETIGFTFEKTLPRCAEGEINIIDYIKLVLNAILLTQEFKEGSGEKEIVMSTEVNGKKMRATDFDLSQKEKQLLLNNGTAAALQFLKD